MFSLSQWYSTLQCARPCFAQTMKLHQSSTSLHWFLPLRLCQKSSRVQTTLRTYTKRANKHHLQLSFVCNQSDYLIRIVCPDRAAFKKETRAIAQVTHWRVTRNDVAHLFVFLCFFKHTQSISRHYFRRVCVFYVKIVTWITRSRRQASGTWSTIHGVSLFSTKREKPLYIYTHGIR